MAGPTGCAVAKLGAGLLALLGVREHLCRTLLAKDLLASIRACEADKVIDCGLVSTYGVKQGVCGGVCVIALSNSVLPGLSGVLGFCRG